MLERSYRYVPFLRARRTKLSVVSVWEDGVYLCKSVRQCVTLVIGSVTVGDEQLLEGEEVPAAWRRARTYTVSLGLCFPERDDVDVRAGAAA